MPVALPVLAAMAVMAALAVGGCTRYESAYERSVYDFEPIYCYQTIGGVDCRRQPFHRDSDRLVNYYGPAPSKYDPPEPPPRHKLRPPPKGPGYWRDPEPVPGPPDEGDAGEDEGARDAAGAGADPQGAPRLLLPPAVPAPSPPPAPPSPSPPLPEGKSDPSPVEPPTET